MPIIYFIFFMLRIFAMVLIGKRNIHSFISDINIVPLQETYSETLSVQLRSKTNVLRSLQKEDTLFWGSKRSVRGSWFQVEGPITEKALRCLIKSRAGPRNQARAHHEPKNEGLCGKLNPKPAYSDQSSKMGHNQLQIARQVLKPYIKCVGRQEASAGHHVCKQKPRHIWGYDQ